MIPFHNNNHNLLDGVIAAHARENLVLDINAKLVSIQKFYENAVRDVVSNNVSLRGVMTHVNGLCGAFAPHIQIEIPTSSPSQGCRGDNWHAAAVAGNSVVHHDRDAAAQDGMCTTAALYKATSGFAAAAAYYEQPQQQTCAAARLSYLRQAAATIVEGLTCLQQHQGPPRRCHSSDGGAAAAASLCFGETLWVLDATFSCSGVRTTTPSDQIECRGVSDLSSLLPIVNEIVADAVLSLNESLLCVVQRSSEQTPTNERDPRVVCSQLMLSHAAACATGDALLKDAAAPDSCHSAMPAARTNDEIGPADRFKQALHRAQTLIQEVVITRSKAATAGEDRRAAEAARQVCATLRVLERHTLTMFCNSSASVPPLEQQEGRPHPCR
jgi:hypothetical protein